MEDSNSQSSTWSGDDWERKHISQILYPDCCHDVDLLLKADTIMFL